VPADSPNLHDLRIARETHERPTRRGRTWGLVVAIIGLAVAATMSAAWLLPKATAVRTATVSRSGGGTAGGVSASGYVVARTKASVSAKISGRLEYLGVSEGSRVKQGQVLARIEAGVYRAQVAAQRADVAEGEARLAQSRRNLERARSLRDQNVISQLELENAETDVRVDEASLESFRAQLRLAEENLENTLVRAPFDGTVLRKDAEVGEIVAPASAGGGLTRTAIVTMADLATLEVEVDVNEAYIARVRNGQESRITLDAYPDTSFSGRVRQVVPTADRQKATVLVKVSILDRDPRILPEMGAKVVFAEGDSPAATAPIRITVPVAAIVRDGEAARVWVVENARVAMRPIEAGRTIGNLVEVRSGLSGSEVVVVEPPPGLTEGMRVKASPS
jgi:RND family efflux transporter MFP subunit